MSPTLSDLETLARQAGEILRAGYDPRPGFRRNLQIHYKSAIDPVTEMDHKSEAFLLSEIQRRFPSHAVVSEESGRLSGDLSHTWYIDPLDGTVNYAHGVPLFSVSIGYAEGGQLKLGAVYDPIQDECFSAERGSGSRLNGQLIQASSVQTLDQSLLVTGFPYDIRTNPENNLDYYIRFSKLSQGVRRLGSAALDLCYVAAGRLDGFWEIRLSVWDIAAGALIAQEAGAVVTDLNGGSAYMSPPHSILTANRYIHPQMLEVFKG